MKVASALEGLTIIQSLIMEVIIFSLLLIEVDSGSETNMFKMMRGRHYCWAKINNYKVLNYFLLCSRLDTLFVGDINQLMPADIINSQNMW